jgi:hypothetical protein
LALTKICLIFLNGPAPVIPAVISVWLNKTGSQFEKAFYNFIFIYKKKVVKDKFCFVSKK